MKFVQVCIIYDICSSMYNTLENICSKMRKYIIFAALCIIQHTI